MMFCQTLNLAKQSIALALCLIAYVEWDKRGYKKSFFIWGLSLTFHLTSVIMLFFIFERYVRSFFLRILLVILLLFTIMGDFAIITKLLGFSDLFSIRFSRYIEDNNGDFSFLEAMYRFFLIVSVFLLYKYKKIVIASDQIKRILYFFIVELLLFSFCYISGQAGRVSYYVMPMYFIFIPYLLQCCCIRKRVQPLLLISLFSYWILTIIIQGSTETYPYISIL